MAKTLDQVIPAQDEKRMLRDLRSFDFSLEAELYPARSRKAGRPVSYKRFITAAEAIRFAIEDLPPPALLGACLEVGEVRYDKSDMQRLYESAEYPLARASTG